MPARPRRSHSSSKRRVLVWFDGLCILGLPCLNHVNVKVLFKSPLNNHVNGLRGRFHLLANVLLTNVVACQQNYNDRNISDWMQEGEKEEWGYIR